MRGVAPDVADRAVPDEHRDPAGVVAVPRTGGQHDPLAHPPSFACSGRSLQQAQSARDAVVVYGCVRRLQVDGL
jgi:hypothetical protein